MTIDERANLQGYLAIDSTVNGCCHGGLRMARDITPDLIARVARSMTLKYGFVGLPKDFWNFRIVMKNNVVHAYTFSKLWLDIGNIDDLVQ